ncbi:MAG TPA: alpha/beta hydrolase, partial [Patescibacteria group bacterium]|nr:alpha/beta hydrolase [Patescibacteria group bacterium]
IDFRGHGESEGGDYKKFKNEDHQKYFLDSRAGFNYLEERYGHPNFLVGGASIGANIALQCMAHDVHIKKGLILSAGLDYHGVKALNFVENLTEDQNILFAAAKDDMRTSQAADMAFELYNSTSCERQKVILEYGGHGTEMLDTDADFFAKAADFLT